MISQTCIYGGESCGPQPELFGGLCSQHYRLLRRLGFFKDPELATTVSGASCNITRGADPGGSSPAGRRSLHGLCRCRLPRQAAAEGAKSKAAAKRPLAESRNTWLIGRSGCEHQVRSSAGKRGRNRSVMRTRRGPHVGNPSVSLGTCTRPTSGADLAPDRIASECCCSSCSRGRVGRP